MNNNSTPLLLLALLLSLCLTSCKNIPEKPVKSEINTVVKTVEDNKGAIKSPVEKETEENTIPKSFKSRLRPNEQLELGTIYTDTVTYVDFNNIDYDEVLFSVNKNDDTIVLISEDTWEGKYFKEQEIIINWKIDSIRPVGDPEYLDFKEFLVSSTKVKTSELNDKNVKVLWRETLYDEALKTTINTLVLNKEYQKNITEPERAALGYVATFVGNECEWDSGSPDENRSNLDCKLLSYLDLGYQCSDKHLGFLNNWFSKDSVALNKLKRCPTIPNSATKQSTFDEVSLKTNTQDQTIAISYKVEVINVRESSVSHYTKVDTFKYNSEGIILIDSEKRTNNSFVISCGSGCAMTYTEHKIVTNNNSSEVTFKIEMFVNEVLSKEYYETYSYTCTPSNNNAEIKLKDDANYHIENQHPEIQEKLKSYIPQLCEKIIYLGKLNPIQRKKQSTNSLKNDKKYIQAQIYSLVYLYVSWHTGNLHFIRANPKQTHIL